MSKPSNIRTFLSLFGTSAGRIKFDHCGDIIFKIHKVIIDLMNCLKGDI